MADSAAVQNALLRELHYQSDAVSLDHLVVKRVMSRKSVLMALGKLMRRDYVELIKPKPALTRGADGRIARNETPCPEYRLTKQGHDFVRSGKTIASGPRAPLSGQRKRRRETFRSRMWAAMRMERKFTVSDIVEVCRRPTDRDPHGSVERFLLQLRWAGIVVALPVKAPGYAPTSNGFARYALIRDLGPKQPLGGRRWLFDPNCGEKIPYRKKST